MQRFRSHEPVMVGNVTKRLHLEPLYCHASRIGRPHKALRPCPSTKSLVHRLKLSLLPALLLMAVQAVSANV